MSKGSRSRVTDRETYRRNYDSIFKGGKGLRGNETGNEKPPNPGSPEAVKAGCKCPVSDNENGRGADWGPNTYWINGECPIHGDALVPWEKLKEACGIKNQSTANSPKISDNALDKPRRPNTIRGAHKRRAD